MAETVEQLKERAERLCQSPDATNEQVDALNQAAWELRYINDPLGTRLIAKALQLADRNCYERGRARSLHNGGWSHLFTHQFEEAEQSLQESYQIFLRLEDNIGLSSALNGLAVAKGKTGDHETAFENHFAALRLRQKIGDSAGIASVLNNLGLIHKRSGDYALALDYYYRALEVALDSRMPAVQVHAYSNLGDVLWRVGEVGQSIERSQQALDLYLERSNRLYEGATLISLGAAHHSRREYQTALGYYARGLEIAQAARNFEAQIEAQTYLGNIYCETGDWQTALIHLSQASHLSQTVNSRFYESQTLLRLGLVYRQIGRQQQSIEALTQALEISEELKAKDIRCKAHLALSQVFEEQNKLAEALRHHQAFHHIWQEMFGIAALRRIEQILLQRELKTIPNKKLKLPAARKTVDAADVWRGGGSRAALTPRKLQEVANFIARHLEQNLTLAALADMIGLSQNYFLRSFKQATGKTPHQFLIEQRVARAKELLRTSRLPLAEIALRCGFSSQSHLTTHFRLLTGETPRAFRHSSKHNQPNKS